MNDELRNSLTSLIESVIMQKMAKQVTTDGDLLTNADDIVFDKAIDFENALNSHIAKVVADKLNPSIW